MRRPSRIHRRWMGSHALVGLTLLTDLVAVGLTYLAGGYLVPFVWSVLVWLFQAIGLLIGHFAGALQADLALYSCLGVGTLIGLLLALGLGGAFDGPYSSHQGSLGKAFLAFLLSVVAALFCWIIIAQVLHKAPWFWPPSLSWQGTINSTWAMIWLIYYVAVRGIYILSAPGQFMTMPGQYLYRYDLVGQQLMLTNQTSTPAPPLVQASVPLSRAHPGGPKWEHIQRCYELYRKGLARFSPQPFSLKEPDGFRYYDDGGQQMYWYKHTLLIPQVFLEPVWSHALLPELARQLMYHQAPDLRVFELLNSYPRAAGETFFLLGTLNFLWVPTVVKNIAAARWQGERVLDADAFAYMLGEGKRLRARLRTEQEALRREGLADSTFPTLDERLEHLNAWINEEVRQLQNLGYTWDTSQKYKLPLAIRQLLPAAHEGKGSNETG